MAIYLLDPSVIIDALNQKRGRWQLLASLVEAGETLACSVVTLTEIYTGGFWMGSRSSICHRGYGAGSQPGVDDG